MFSLGVRVALRPRLAGAATSLSVAGGGAGRCVASAAVIAALRRPGSRARGRARTPRRAAARPTARRRAPRRGRRSRRARRSPRCGSTSPARGLVPTLQDGWRSRCPGAGQDTSPPRGTLIPARRWKYSGGAIRLYGSALPAPPSRRPVRGPDAADGGSGRSPTSSSIAYGCEREVGLEHARPRAGLVVDRAGQAHHARALGAARVGDVGPAVARRRRARG